MNIPVVVHHVASCPDYLKKCIEINALKNTVYLIGDKTNDVFQYLGAKVHHIDVQTLSSIEAKIFEKFFINYSTNNAYREYLCFERFFILKEFMKQYGFEKIAYVDSDCVLLEDVSVIAKDISCGLSMQNVDSPYHMVSCIHNSILTIELCNAFMGLCRDIYVNKSKFHLIEDKVKWHKNNNIAGGICDMTLCYFITRDHMVDGLIDMNIPIIYNGEKCVFDHNIGVSYGFEGEQTYVMDVNQTKTLSKCGDKYYAKTVANEDIRLLSIHFSGSKKHILTQLDTKTFFT